MKTCVNCGHELEDSALFCEECGSKQQEPDKVCPECGKVLPGRAKFCAECGINLLNAAGAQKTKGPAKEESTSISPSPTGLKYEKGETEISLPDAETLLVVINGLPFKLKLVVGRNEADDFLMAETPVTQALWMTLTGSNPSNDNENLEFPVTNVKKQEITAFLLKLLKITGLKFQLPNAEQWDYAYIGGHKSQGFDYPGSNQIEEVAWQEENKIHPVASLFPNELQIYDLLGNVAEYLKDYSNIGLKSDLSGTDNENVIGLRLILTVSSLATLTDPSLKAIAENIKAEAEKDRQEAAKVISKIKKDKAKKDAEAKEREKIQQIINNYSVRGVFVYDKNDKEFEKYLPEIMGEEYVKHLQESDTIQKEVKEYLKKHSVEWTTLGVVALDTAKKGFPPESINTSIKYTLIKDTVVIKGSGEMNNFYEEGKNGNYIEPDNNLLNKKRLIKSAVILEGIKSIGNQLFNDWDALTHVILPEGLTKICEEALSGCKFPYILIPQSLRVIEDYALWHEHGLRKIFIPSNVKEIGFKGVTGTNENTISQIFVCNTTNLDEEAFVLEE